MQELTQTVLVELSATGATIGTGGNDLDIATTVSITVPRSATATTVTAPVTVSYTPETDDDLDDETVVITGTVNAGMDDEQSGTLTLNVADDDDPEGTITISTSLESIRENSRTRNVVVTAELDRASGTGDAVTVTVKVTGGEKEETVQIPIAAGENSGTATVPITPMDDEVFSTRSITVTGSIIGYTSGTAMIEVVDDDDSIGSLTITVAEPPSVTEGTATNVTLTVKGLIYDKEVDSGTVTATLTTTAGTFPNGTATQELTINMADHDDLVPDEDSPDGTEKIVLSLSATDVATEGTKITVTASANMYDSGSRVIPVRDPDAADVQGYRLVVVKPAAAGGWANDANDQVIVDVMRVGSVAYPWSDFDNIRVSVRDTAHDNSDPPHQIDWVMASNFNLEDNGAVTFDETHAGNSRGDVIWRGNDTIRFEIQIHHCRGDRTDGTTAQKEADARDDGKCGPSEPSSNGQYLGAYVVADFTVGTAEPLSLSNRDSDKPVYPSNPTLVDEANRYVGDGKLFKVDNLDPSKAAIAAVRVTSGSGDDEVVGGAIDATVGDEIRVAIKVSGDILFRESGLRVQLQTHDGTGEYMGISYPPGDVAPVTVTKNFTAAQVIAAVSDSLRHTWKITEGFFKMKTDNYIEGIGAKGITFQPDNVRARVLVAVKDQANNWSNPDVTAFDADSRSPSVSILYPSADPDSIYEHTHSLRFTGAVESIVEGQNQDDHLNPLAILVDEDLSALKVYAVGADTLDIFDQIPSNVIGDSTAVYDTSTLSSTKKDGEAGTDDDEYQNTDYVPSSANRAGTEIELAVLATDLLGNTTKTTISGVTHDASPPVITEWFPKNSLLPEDQINDATPPIFTLSEDVDSIAVTFEGSDGSDVVKERGGVTTKGEDSIDFSGALEDEVVYDMMIFVRDLAGNVFITPADSSSGMRFNAQFDNPVANRFKVTTDTDSVIAGQANMLTLQAEDHDSGSNTTRNALTYKNAVRISAWDTGGGAAESVWFEGTGVTDDADSPDGVLC